MLLSVPRNVLGRAFSSPMHNLPMHNSPMRVPLRAMGLYDRFVESQQEKSAEVAKKQFDTLISTMCAIDRYTLNHHFDSLKEGIRQAGIGRFTSMIPSVKNNPMYQEFKMQEAILEAMTPAERAGEIPIKAEEKRRIAATAKVEVSDVNRALQRFDEMQKVHKWIRNRHREGKPMPKDMYELSLWMGPRQQARF
eukprot:TRINITY_DN3073_c0_g1_i1.p1 TRINITY_DN3073_c0_g1~~TRINITY_DN3073_c0_g1_i1.p1  ORF type:complete len:194 (-),score=42.66 TRINITY_DN3073_c0_g1_i1:669-1250(-)